MSTSIMQPPNAIPLSVRLVSTIIVPAHVLKSLLAIILLSIFPVALPNWRAPPNAIFTSRPRRRTRPVSVSSTISSSQTLVDTANRGCIDDAPFPDQWSTISKSDEDTQPLAYTQSCYGSDVPDSQQKRILPNVVRQLLPERYIDPPCRPMRPRSKSWAPETMYNGQRTPLSIPRIIQVIKEDQPPGGRGGKAARNRREDTEKQPKVEKVNKFMRFSRKIKTILRPPKIDHSATGSQSP